MKISIIGTGAIGGYYGIMLANAGHEVHFLLHSDYEYVERDGLLLRSEIHGKIYLPEVKAYSSSADMPKSDVVLVALKTTLNKEVLVTILPPLVDKNCIVVLIQNGLGMEEELSKQFPSLQIAGGVALVSSHKTEKGVVVHQDHGDLDLGNYNITDISILNDFSAELSGAGIPSSIQDLNYLRWKKLIWNMSFNGLSVVLNSTTNQILADERNLKRCKTIMAEVIQGAKSCNVILPDIFIEEMIAFTRSMRPYSPSMKLDYESSRPMELEYIYDRPILAARKSGYEMAETSLLYEELTELNRKF